MRRRLAAEGNGVRLWTLVNRSNRGVSGVFLNINQVVDDLASIIGCKGAGDKGTGGVDTATKKSKVQTISPGDRAFHEIAEGKRGPGKSTTAPNHGPRKTAIVDGDSIDSFNS